MPVGETVVENPITACASPDTIGERPAARHNNNRQLHRHDGIQPATQVSAAREAAAELDDSGRGAVSLRLHIPAKCDANEYTLASSAAR